MKNIPIITIQPKPLDMNIPNTGGGTGNPFVNWGPAVNFSGNTGVNNIPNYNPPYAPPSINIPNNIPNTNIPNIKELPRIATENEFAATCHGGIAVDSIIDHAITRNSQGYGANALASLKTLNLSHNYLGDEKLQRLNDGLYRYTLNLQSFNFSNNSMGAVGLDHLIKGSIGIAHLQAGGNDINNMMQGILTLPSTSIVCLNLANNNIGDIGADILGHALANGKLPATKYIDVSGNGITQNGEFVLTEGMKKALNTDLNITFVKTGWKNTDPMWKIPTKLVLKEFLEHAKNQGIDTEYVATNKSTLDYILDGLTIGKNIIFGVKKCSNVLLEILSFNTTAPSITKGFALEMYGTKAIKKADFRVCVLLETHEAIVSEEGVDLAVKAVDLLGNE